MFYVYNDFIFSSDWHLTHSNIILYEPKRLNLYGDSKKLLDLSQFEQDNELLKQLYLNLEKILNNNNNIKYFYNLGDLIFNIGQQKKEFVLNIKYFYDIFNLLKKYNIKSYLILGNHESTKYNNFYKQFFNDVLYYNIIENGDTLIVITHYPLGQTLLKDEKNNKIKINKEFYEVEKYILGILTKKVEKNKNIKKIINFHGHIHSNLINDKSRLNNRLFSILDIKVQHNNMSIENLF